MPLMDLAARMGIARPEDLRRLVGAGHTPGTQRRNHLSGHLLLAFLPADIRAFEEKFTTYLLVGDVLGISRQKAASFLRRNGLRPFTSDGERFGSIYLRHEVDALLGRLDPASGTDLTEDPKGPAPP
jgi:hypothetical protein